MQPRILTHTALTILALALALPLRAERIVLVAGGGTDDRDGIPATQARLKEPFGAGFDRAGNMFIVEMAQGQRVRKVDAGGTITTVAGTGQKGEGGDGGPALKAQFNGIHNLAIAPDDTIYLADTWNCRIRAIDPKTGLIITVAGTGVKGYSGDSGPAAQAQLGGIYCAALDAKGQRLYLADLHNLRVRYLELNTGTVHLAAGNGQKGAPKDGARAVDSPLVDPRAVAVDSRGRVYVLERGGNALRVIGPGGKVRTVVNASGKKGNTGDGGPALEASLNGPKHICVDHEDNVIIADAENHLIRKFLTREGRIVRVAGTGKQGAAGLGGPPEQCELSRPHGVTVHRDGTLYITDSYNNRVLKIEK